MYKVRTVEDGVNLLRGVVDWSLLDRQLGHFFLNESTPPLQLMIGLLYIQAINNDSYEEIIEQWTQSESLQNFCGGLGPDLERPVSPAMLSILKREIGEVGESWMRSALCSGFIMQEVSKRNSVTA